MRLLNILRSLIGEAGTELAPLDGFRAMADSNGVNFYLPQLEFTALQSGTGNALQTVQLIVVNVRREDEVGGPTANGCHVRDEDGSGLDLEEADIVRLPRRLHGRFIASSTGRAGESGFQVALMVLMPGEGSPVSF